ncbi:MAG: cadherin-like beta sandwich domain-containing protein [Bacteroidota bacterium]
MKKLLHLLKNSLIKDTRSFFAALLVFALIAVCGQSQAQVYYVTTAGSISAADAGDALSRVNYDGTSNTTIAGSIAVSPTYSALDLANNRIFVYEAVAAGRSIKVLNATTGEVTSSIAVLSGISNVNALKYDAVNNYIYYLTTDGSALSTTATDALVRVKPDGTGQTVLASSFTPSPLYLALDIPNNRVFVYESLNAQRGIKTVSLSSGTITQSATVSTGTVKDIAYDPNTDFLYYLTSDDIALNVATNDALMKVKPDGTNTTVVKGSITGSPVQFILDIGNNRAFLYEGATANKAIKTVDLSTGNVVSILSLSSFASTRVVTSMTLPGAPVVTTTAASSISSVTTTLGGNVTSSDVTVSERGVVYSSTNSAPTVGGSGVTKASNGSGTGSFSASISSLSPATTYYVRAYAISGAGTSYGSVSSFTTLSNDANLSAFSISAGTLTPGFSSSTTSYTASVTGGTTTITVTPTKNQANATIKVNNVTVASGSASAPITLNIGDNIITTVVTAQDGSTTKTYILTVTRTKLSQTITFNTLPAKNYGDADFVPGATASSSLTVSYSSDNTSVATITGGGLVHIVAPGTANITAIQSGDGNYNAATSAVQTLTVGKATVTVTANAQTKIYGANDPVFTYTATGVVGTDAPTGELTRLSPNINKFIGTYAIEQGTLSYGNNYNVTYTGANLTINKRPITVLPVGKTKVYGDADPFLNQFQITAGSLAPGDATGDQFGRAAGESIGTYLMTLGTKKFYGEVNGNYQDITSNYDITVQPAYVTITAKPITVTANAQSKIYGDADPELTYTTSTDLAFSDTFTGTLTRVAGEEVGNYAITQGTLALTSNYVLTFNGNYLTIGKKTINVTANAKMKSYGDPDPALDYTADALAFSDSFTGSLTRDAGEIVGAYTINQGSLALNSNYILNYTGANLYIGAKTINVTAISANKTYGDSDPAFTYNADALVGADTFSGSLTRISGETAGNYAIKQGLLALNSNYTINYTGANLTIGKRDITINAYAQNVPYGDADPAISYSTTGNTLVNGDTFTGALGRAAGTAIGTYAITQNTLTISNSNSYNLTFNSAAYNIIPRPITISSPLKVKVYGDADPVLTYSITSGSLLSGDVLSGTLVRDAGENSGPYTVRQGTLAVNSSNYNVNYVLGNFEIDRAPLTIKADDKSKLVNAPNPTFTYTITGFKNGDDESALSSPVSFQNLPLSSAPSGTYSIDLANVSAPNYDITPISGVLTIRDASTNANLTALSVAGYTISPSFDPDNLNYTLAVAQNVSTINVTGTLADANSKLFRIGSFNAVSGQPNNVTVSPGENQISIMVTAEDNSTSKEYIITVTRPYETDATLSALSVSEGTLSPAFSTTQHTYTVTVGSSVESIKLDPISNSIYGFIKVNGSPVETGYSPARSLNPGDNIFNIEVLAQDRSISEVYKVTVVRTIKLSNNASIKFSLTPASALVLVSGNRNYTASVSSETPSVTLTPTAQGPNATILVNGVAVTSGTASGPIVLNAGPTVINIFVTAEDGVTTAVYAVTVNKTGSSNAALASLLTTSNSKVTLQSNTSNLVEYITSVSTATASITLTAVLKDSNATMTINGSPVISGQASSIIPLATGTTTVPIIVTAEDGVTTKRYNLLVNRTGLSVATLASLSISPASVLTVTSNSASLVQYVTSVSTGTTSVTLTPKLKDSNSTITINGAPAVDGAASSPILLNAGATTITIIVTAEDGIATKTYTLVVNHTGSSLAGLTALGISPSSKLIVLQSTSRLVEYTTSVGYAVTSIKLTPTVKDANSTVTINGSPATSGVASAPILLPIGVTTATVVVTAEDGVTTKTYTVAITRAGSNNANLAVISVSPRSVLAIKSNSASLVEYTTTVSASTESIKLKPTLQEPNATFTINGSPAVNDTLTAPILLSPGVTSINIVVTAQNGTTIRTYNIAVTKPSATTLMVNRNDSKSLFANKSSNKIVTDNDDVVVHKGLSPNGDGFNDFLVIEGLSSYTNSKLSVMNTSGSLVFDMKDYGKDGSRVFEGRAKNGTLLKAGTYYYTLDYKDGDKDKRKTGYIILKF